MKHISILLMTLLYACTPPAEPPAPPETTTTAPPVEPPVKPPPVPEGKEPADYPLLSRAPAIAEELGTALQESAWGGWRDPLYVADKCSWALQPNVKALFPMTHDEMQEFANAGAGLDVEGAGFVERLPQVNKRCVASHPEHAPEFCGRSDVLRTRLNEFRGRLSAHLDLAQALRDVLRGEPHFGISWNSIKGWCEYTNE